jgi:hypothetical protein
LGARHGFEFHYQSEDIIAQLANVSRISDYKLAKHTASLGGQ